MSAHSILLLFSLLLLTLCVVQGTLPPVSCKGQPRCYGPAPKDYPEYSPDTAAEASKLYTTKGALFSSEHKVLLAMYNDLNGKEWTNTMDDTNKNKWDASTDHCYWYGITCAKVTTGSDPYITVTDAYVTHIELPKQKVYGTLTAAHGGFTKLRGINLESNCSKYMSIDNYGRSIVTVPMKNGNVDTSMCLTGELPAGWFNPSLSFVRVSGNYIGNAFPATISSATNLKLFLVDWNNFSGPIPAGLFTNKIESIHVEGNDLLTGGISDVTACVNLVELSAYRIYHSPDEPPSGTGPTQPPPPGLSLPLPSDWSKCTALRLVYLQHNSITGPLPPSLLALPNLEELILDFNAMSGPLPEFAQNSKLTQLSLRRNAFTGPIPASFGNALSLYVLNLGDNKLSNPPGTSPIPKTLANIVANASTSIPSGLRLFNIAGNLFSGQIDSAVLNWLLQTVINHPDSGQCSIVGGVGSPNSNSPLTCTLDTSTELIFNSKCALYCKYPALT